jgi:hypothetical protein
MDILTGLDLLAALRDWGEARVVGSVALDLIVKRDIDVHLLVRHADLWAVAHAVLARLTVGVGGSASTHIHDYAAAGGLKVGIENYPGASGEWTIDIWITNRSDKTAFAQTERLKRALTPTQRARIMAIKRALVQEGAYPAGTGLLIYQAVTEQGIDSVAAFRAHLHETGDQGGGRQDSV